MEHHILGRSLECGTLSAKINTLHHTDSLLSSYLLSLGNKFGIVSLAHIGETVTIFYILTAQGMFGEGVDVILDNHKVTDDEIGVHTTSCI